MKKLPTIFLLFTTLLVNYHISYADELTFTIVSQNLRQFYDDNKQGGKEKVLTSKKYKKRIRQLVFKISTEFNFADVIALQEIENIAILTEVSKQLIKLHAIKYQPVLLEGNDVSGIDVGFLVKTNYKVKWKKGLFKNHKFKNREPLFSRPPLAIELCPAECFTIVNVHLRSMRGLKSTRHQKRTAFKRRLQAETLARWIDGLQRLQPEKKLIIIGDFNALTPSDSYVDSLGTIIGQPDQKRPRWKSTDLINTDLFNTSTLIRDHRPFSYRYKKVNQLLDYLLVSNNMKNRIKAVDYSSIDYKFSDHAAIKATVKIN